METYSYHNSNLRPRLKLNQHFCLDFIFLWGEILEYKNRFENKCSAYSNLRESISSPFPFVFCTSSQCVFLFFPFFPTFVSFSFCILQKQSVWLPIFPFFSVYLLFSFSFLYFVEAASRDGISVKNSTDEYFSPKIAHKTRISRHIAIRAKTA